MSFLSTLFVLFCGTVLFFFIFRLIIAFGSIVVRCILGQDLPNNEAFICLLLLLAFIAEALCQLGYLLSFVLLL